jgi:AraC family transcriptional regulator of adaptative response/methylated-DNA-[protein]-cysteine methyltransferase
MLANHPVPATDAARWTALRARDKAADDTFVYSVKTTGVYCRPSCAARPARPENVAFHDSPAAAERAGFRACKRCKPDQPPLAERQAAQIAALCRMIVTGVTPRAYAAAHRARRVRGELASRATVTEAIYGAGYNSSARFYEASNAVLGMTPTAFRAGGRGAEIRFALGQCTLGAILVAATARGVCAILLGDDPEALVHDLERKFPRAQLVGADPAFERLVAQAVGLVEQPGVGSELPLDIRGTAFQQRVWKALRRIPAGKTVSYRDIAQRIGAPRSVRAVAQAIASNSIAIAIPCHRVIRTDGDLSGYRWGVERKRALLDREAVRETGPKRRARPEARS